MKGKYKKKKIWCSCCDAQIIELGKKCTNCGKREYTSKIKKPNTKKIIKDYED